MKKRKEKETKIQRVKNNKDNGIDLSHLFSGTGLIKIGEVHHIEYLLFSIVFLPIKLLWIIGLVFLLVFIGMNIMSIYKGYTVLKIKKKQVDKESKIKEEMIDTTLDKKFLDELNKTPEIKREDIIKDDFKIDQKFLDKEVNKKEEKNNG